MSLVTKFIFILNPLVRLIVLAVDVALYVFCRENLSECNLFMYRNYILPFIYISQNLFNNYAWLRFKRVQVQIINVEAETIIDQIKRSIFFSKVYIVLLAATYFLILFNIFIANKVFLMES